ncbi:MAG TPA: CHAP domain-containing protein, partial [Candidatus Saccharimonadaceae bacterium]|nr:CHAP domain-containing protein [Candidatus Saccharimonadaceae bacterium]
MLALAEIFSFVTPAQATLATNDYPLANGTIDATDSWGFGTRECVSFVAWRLSHDNGMTSFSNNMNGGHFGNAYQWKQNAINLFGSSVYNETPAAGSVAWWDSNHGEALANGHVAYVDSVNTTNGSINIEEYNTYHNPYGYWSETIPTTSLNWPSGFLHLKDLGVANGGSIMGLLNSGNYIYAKSTIIGPWNTQWATATEIALGGNRMAVLDSNGEVWAKDGTSSPWSDQGAIATKIAVGSSGRMMITVPGGEVWAKDSLGY